MKCKHITETEILQCTNFASCHPSRVEQGFLKGEAQHPLRTDSSPSMFNKNAQNFNIR